MKELRCIGCGALLQSIDKNKLGYVPSSLASKDNLICQRCFRLKNYGEFKSYEISDDNFEILFKDIAKKKALVFYVLDCFNLDGSIMNKYVECLNNDIYIIVNKLDIMPKSTKKDRLINKTKELLKNIKYKDIILASTIKKINIDKITKIISSSHNKNVFFIGNNNTGKSSLVNAIKNALSIDKENKSLVSFYPGTTLNTISFVLKNYTIYDTPGLTNTNNIYELLNTKNIKKVYINSEIKPISMSMYDNNSLFIGSIVRLDFKLEDKTNLSVYSSNLIKYHHTKTIDIETKTINLIKDSLYVPKLSSVEEYDDITYLLDGNRISINLFGLSTIDVLNGKGSVTIHKPKNLKTSIGKSIYGGR